ncbi:CHAT domain-containing protein [Oculatella sp. FACHB-28]|uniref:CHAT domain-containing protein n=1 Tax=Oculatella sp. FACHB-28 TaxID=2692845 RepID=UPI001682B395|nr:CHAT domain-containing protein [Oculatella sp. FACHB-28]MBD2057634.1 CHAT domain-containing protein [Oculatella sp. FACHB-28]
MKASICRICLFILGFILTVGISSQSLPAYSTEVAVVPEAGARIAEVEQLWRGQYETYFGNQLVGTPLTAEQISATLGRLNSETDKNFALIYAFPQPEELELLLVIPETPSVRVTVPEAGQQELLEVANEFKTAVSRPTGARRDLTSAKQLYDWLIAPLEPQLQAQNIDTLIVCGGAILRSLPFAALHDGQQFLVEKYNLGLVPAFNLINQQHSNFRNEKVLAMGASEFQAMPTLHAVPLELSTITQDIWQSEVFLNQEFTLNNLAEQLESGEFGIVHLATHAQFRPGTPENSYIQLWQNDKLTLDQLRQLDWSELPVELLVLSACQTALGDRQAELGFAGLAFQAGVKSSVASLWQVSDLGTLALMREFYWQLANPEVTTKTEALRRTQIAMLSGNVRIEDGQIFTSAGILPLPEDLEQFQNLDLSAPYYWSAFTLVGSPW